MLYWHDCYRAEEAEALAARRACAPDADDDQAWLDLSDLVQRLLVAGARQPAANAAPPRLPAQVFHYWDQSQPPADVADCIGTWDACGLPRQTVDRDEAETFLREEFGGDVLAAFRHAHHPAMQADLYRLGRLWRLGGLYVDADDAFVEPASFSGFRAGAAVLALAVGRATGHSLAPVIADPDAARAWYYLNNAPIFSVPGHRLVELALERAVAAVSLRRQRGELAVIHRDTGPTCLSMAALDYVAECFRRDRPLDLSVSPGWPFLAQALPLAYKRTDRNWRSNAVLYRPAGLAETGVSIDLPEPSH